MSVRRVLLVFDECGPGDAYRASFALRAVRAAHPSAEIVLLVGEQAAEVFERSAIPSRVVVSRLYVPVHRPALRARFDKMHEIARLMRELGFSYDLAITFFWGSLALNLLVLAVARLRVGYVNRFAFLQSLPLGAYDPLGDSLTQNVRLLSAAGIDSGKPGLEPLAHSRADGGAVQRLLQEHQLNDGRKFVVFHAGSDWACQQWSVQSWAELADLVIDGYGVDVVWTGDASERSYVDQIRGRMRHNTIAMCGETTTLHELSVLLAQASLCVSVDSVPSELAVAEGIPVIVLAGPTVPESQGMGRIAPIVINRTTPELRLAIVRCKEGFAHGRCHDYSCPMSQMVDINVDEVLARVAETGALAPGTELLAASR